MEEDGFRLTQFADSDPLGSSLTYSLFKKQLDCDTSSALVVGVAHSLGWNDVSLVIIPEQVFVRWRANNYDYGEETID